MTGKYQKRLIELVEELEKEASTLLPQHNDMDYKILWGKIIYLKGYIEVLKDNQPE